MKEYDVFVEANGDITAYCGGQFALACSNEGLFRNFARLWEVIDTVSGERLMELQNMGVNCDGVQTYRVSTLPKS